MAAEAASYNGRCAASPPGGAVAAAAFLAGRGSLGCCRNSHQVRVCAHRLRVPGRYQVPSVAGFQGKVVILAQFASA